MRYIMAGVALFIAFSFGLLVRGLTIESEMQMLDDCMKSRPFEWGRPDEKPAAALGMSGDQVEWYSIDGHCVGPCPDWANGDQ